MDSLDVFGPERESVRKFLEFKEFVQNRSASTARTYRYALTRLKDFAGDTPLLNLTWDDLQVFAGAYMLKCGTPERGRTPLIAAVREFFKYAHQSGWVHANPAAALPYPKKRRHLPTAMTTDWAEKLILAPGLKTFTGLRDTLIFMLLASNPRVSGVTNLNESSLRFTDTPDGQQQLTIRVEEKGKHSRDVPVPSQVWIIVRSYLSHEHLREIDRTITNDRGEDDRVLLVNLSNSRKGKKKEELTGEDYRLTPAGVRQRLNIYANRIKMPREMRHPHAMRHMYGAALAEAQVNVLDRMSLMGHAKAETAEIYNHLAEKHRREIAIKAGPLAQISTPGHALLEKLGYDT